MHGVRSTCWCRDVEDLKPAPAHRFFSHSRWSVEAVSTILVEMAVRALVGNDTAVSMMT